MRNLKIAKLSALTGVLLLLTGCANSSSDNSNYTTREDVAQQNVYEAPEELDTNVLDDETLESLIEAGVIDENATDDVVFVEGGSFYPELVDFVWNLQDDSDNTVKFIDDGYGWFNQGQDDEISFDWDIFDDELTLFNLESKAGESIDDQVWTWSVDGAQLQLRADDVVLLYVR